MEIVMALNHGSNVVINGINNINLTALYVKKKLLEPIPKQKLAVMNVKILTSETCVKKGVVDASIA